MAEPLVPLGEIVATHGLLGWLKLNPFNRETTALRAGSEIFLEKFGHQSNHELEAVGPHQRQLLIKLCAIDSLDAAAEYVGTTLSVPQTALDPLPSGQYYHYQVIGFEVFAVSGERIGVIRGILATAGGELYLVQGATKEHLVPAVREIIEKIDFDNRAMTIDPPTGLLDL